MNKNLLFIFIAITIQFNFLIAQSPRSINTNKFNRNINTTRTKIPSFANYYILSDFINQDINNQAHAIPKRKLDSIISTGVSAQDLLGKKLYAYNDHGKLTEFEDLEWDSNLNTWVNIFRNELFYDQNSNLISSVFYQGDQLKWNRFFKSSYEYDLSNRIQQAISYNWDEITSQWIPEYRDTLSYNQKNQIILAESYIWDDNTKKWGIQYKADQVYNAMGQLIMETGYQWESNSKYWINSFRTEWTYHPSGKMYQVISAVWDDTASDWMYISKTEDIYNASNEVINYLDFSFDAIQNSWVNSTKSDFIYDANGNVISELYAIWDIANLKWNVLVKLENSFNNNYSLKDLVIPFTDDYNQNNFHHMLLKTAYFGNSQGNFINDVNDLFYYSPIDVVQTNNTKNLEFQLYPNPAHNEIRFDFSNESTAYQFTMYSMKGEVIQSIEVKNKSVLDIRNLPAGCYYYQIKENKVDLSMGKLIIHK